MASQAPPSPPPPAEPAYLFRRYFVNTLFDANFVVLGILAAEAFGPGADPLRALGTMFAACTAIGISTGVSVFEAEHVEETISLRRTERAMLRRLDETETHRHRRRRRYKIAIVNASGPFMVLGLTGLPIAWAAATGTEGIGLAATASGAVALATIGAAGFYLARAAGMPPWTKAARMSVVAAATFAVLYAVEASL